MIRPTAAVILGIVVLTGCKPADGASPTDPGPSQPPASTTSTGQARFEPEPGRVPANVREYHATQSNRPGEAYAECSGSRVVNYWPNTHAAWRKAVSLCHGVNDYTNRLEAELRRRGFDDINVGG